MTTTIKTKTSVTGWRNAQRPRPYLRGVLRKLDSLADRAIRAGDCAAIEALAVAMNIIEDQLNALRAPSPIIRNGIKRSGEERP